MQRSTATCLQAIETSSFLYLPVLLLNKQSILTLTSPSAGAHTETEHKKHSDYCMQRSTAICLQAIETSSFLYLPVLLLNKQSILTLHKHCFNLGVFIYSLMMGGQNESVSSEK